MMPGTISLVAALNQDRILLCHHGDDARVTACGAGTSWVALMPLLGPSHAAAEPQLRWNPGVPPCMPVPLTRTAPGAPLFCIREQGRARSAPPSSDPRSPSVTPLPPPGEAAASRTQHAAQDTQPHSTKKAENRPPEENRASTCRPPPPGACPESFQPSATSLPTAAEDFAERGICFLTLPSTNREDKEYCVRNAC